MLPVSQAVREALKNGAPPKPLLVITTQGGIHVWSTGRVEDEDLGTIGPLWADGSVRADGSYRAGADSIAVLSRGRRVVSFGALQESLTTGAVGSLTSGLQQNEPDSLTIELTPDALPPKIALHGARAEVRVTWPGVPAREQLQRFAGEVAAVERSAGRLALRLKAVRVGAQGSLDAVLKLKRSEDYPRPRRSGEVLPLVFGDMTERSEGGQWQAICLDTTSFVYALAGHPLESQGTAPVVYNRDGEVIESSAYTFSASNGFEGQGEIATIQFHTVSGTDISFSAADRSINSASGAFSGFGSGQTVVVTGSTSNNRTFKLVSASPTKLVVTADQEVQDESAGATVTVAGDQKDNEPLKVTCKGLAGDSGDLLENPADVAEAMLLRFTDITSRDFDGPSWAQARRLCQTQGYRAAGVITSELRAGDALAGILGSFWGTFWVGGDGRLRIQIDLGPNFLDESQLALHLGPKIMATAQATDQTDDICNQASLRFAPAFLRGGDTKWQGEYSGEDTKNLASQALHGVRLKSYDLPWVRSSEVAKTLAATLVDRYATPPRLLQVRLPDVRGAHLERGDHITISAHWLEDEEGQPLANQVCRILGLGTDIGTGAQDLTLLDTGFFRSIAYRADGSVKADGSRKAGGERDRTEY